MCEDHDLLFHEIWNKEGLRTVTAPLTVARHNSARRVAGSRKEGQKV